MKAKLGSDTRPSPEGAGDRLKEQRKTVVG